MDGLVHRLLAEWDARKGGSEYLTPGEEAAALRAVHQQMRAPLSQEVVADDLAHFVKS